MGASKDGGRQTDSYTGIKSRGISHPIPFYHLALPGSQPNEIKSRTDILSLIYMELFKESVRES